MIRMLGIYLTIDENLKNLITLEEISLKSPSYDTTSKKTGVDYHVCTKYGSR